MLNRREALGLMGSTGIAAFSAGCLFGGGGESFPNEAIEYETARPAGGGNDAYIRALAPALDDVFDVDVNPINKPPAEQRLPELYNGDTVGYNVILISPTILAFHVIEDGRDTPFNPAQWSALGAANQSSLILVSSSKNNVETWDELVSRSNEGDVFNVGLLGLGLGIYYDIIEQNSPVTFERITGYEGTGSLIGDLERGNVDFFIAPASSLLPFVKDGIIDPVLTNEPDVMGDFILDKYAEIGHEGIAETTYAEAELANLGTLVRSIRANLAPPSVPDDNLETLRDGFWEAINSDSFATTAEENDLPIDPLDADELQSTLEEKADILVEM